MGLAWLDLAVATVRQLADSFVIRTGRLLADSAASPTLMSGNAITATMSLAEIQSAYDSEWVLLANPQTTPTLQVTGGQVLFHSKNRDEVYRKARELRPKHSAILFTGKLTEEMAVVL